MSEPFFGPLFTRFGSDKDTNHSYGAVYDRLFPPESRASVTAVLEVGIAGGGGLLAYREAFPNAHCVGLDKEPCHGPLVGSEDARIYPVTPRPPRLEIHQGDMRDRAALMRAAQGRTFDLIVEDSTHQIDDNLRTLFWLWPSLAPGGLYIVEEFDNVHAYWEHIALFRSAELLRTGPPIQDELLLVLRKAP